MQSTVTQRGQTAIPASIRKKYHIEAHSRLEWIDNGRSLYVVPVPLNPIKDLQGKYRKQELMQALQISRVEERKRD